VIIMTAVAAARGALPAVGPAAPAVLGGQDRIPATRTVAAVLAPVPVPGTPAGTFTPGIAAAGAEWDGGQFLRITWLAHTVPGKPEGEVDTRPLRPL
jgi:hypothetical protein